MEIQLLRHATVLVKMNGKRMLVDPMLGRAGVMPAIENSPNPQQNPLIDLSVQLDFQQDIDGVLLTHTHRDHFDETAIAVLPKNKPILCQPEDEEKLQKLGFLEVIPIGEDLCWQGITLHRTAGQHGTGEIALKMAPVSGYVLQAEQEPSLYIAGDTIYYEEVASILAQFQPQVILVNAGGARFLTGDPITMTAQDVAKVCRKAPNARVIAVHMEAINHCLVSRNELRTYLLEEGLVERVWIPLDGENSDF